jgi:hypothetical protein
MSKCMIISITGTTNSLYIQYVTYAIYYRISLRVAGTVITSFTIRLKHTAQNQGPSINRTGQ